VCTIKVCDNETALRRGQDGYKPACKYDYLFFAVIKNLNEVTVQVELDLCGDETIYGHMGYGEPGSGLVSKIVNKPVSKGGQIVLLSDASKNYPLAYLHCHECHKKVDGFPEQGPAEVWHLIEKLPCLSNDKKPQLVDARYFWIVPIQPGATFPLEMKYLIG
jgi:hypothetical protein